MKQKIYTYQLRKGFGTEEFLIEFLEGVENWSFINDLFEALSEIKFAVTSHDNPALDDEIVMNISSVAGDFQFSKDIWNNAFILPVKNQEGIFKVDEILSRSALFHKKVSSHP